MSDQNSSEINRLRAVEASGMLDSPPNPEFDKLTRLAAQLLKAPSAFVTFIGEDRQYIKSGFGAGDDTERGSGTSQPLDMSFCKHAVTSGAPFIVEDARLDPAFRGTKVVDAGFIAYAGIPLKAAGGEAIGALCVVDSRPRAWSQEEIEHLEVLARFAMKLVQERAAATQLERPDEGVGQYGQLLNLVEVHLKAVHSYNRVLERSSVNLVAEARAKDDVTATFEALKDDLGVVRDATDTGFRQLATNYAEAQAMGSAAARQFARGEIDLSELEFRIAREADACDALRLAAMDRGAEL